MLENNKCEACRIGAPKVTEDEKKTFLKELLDWYILVQGVEIRIKYFNFSSYIVAVYFHRKVAELTYE